MMFFEACLKSDYLKRKGWPLFINKARFYDILDVWCVLPNGFALTETDKNSNDWEIGENNEEPV